MMLKTVKKFNETEICSFKNKIRRTSSKSGKDKREQIGITGTRNKRSDVITDLEAIKRITKEYYE